MTYETTYSIGYNKHTPSPKTKATVPTVKRLYQMDAAAKGCKRNSEGQTAVCAQSHASNGFLRTSFLPKLATKATVQTCEESTNMERDFYRSLSQLAAHYHIQPMKTQSFDYPYNIALALWDTEERLKAKVRNWETIRLVQDNKKYFLTSEERYNTGSMLYYIPIVPLFRMLKNPKRKPAAQLLLSVCCYLYHVAAIPYYREEGCYLCWQYEMLKDWVLSDDYKNEEDNYRSELEQSEWIGDYMEQKIFNRANLRVFKRRITKFKSKNIIDHDCWQLACEAFDLYERYPGYTVFKNAQTIEGSEEIDMDNIVTMDKYISFCTDGKGWLSENLEQCVNTELQEYGLLEEPTIVKRFDGSDITGNSLDFENRLFPLMEELIYILNNF